jgi:hypothetical protein
MRKLIAVTAAVCLAVQPALAQDAGETLTVEQIEALYYEAKVSCSRISASNDMGNALQQFMDRKGYSHPERMLFLNYCLMFLTGKLAGVEA